MLPEMGPPETVIYEYPRGDRSWAHEMDEFIADIREGRRAEPGLEEAGAVMKIVEAVYEQSGMRAKKE